VLKLSALLFTINEPGLALTSLVDGTPMTFRSLSAASNPHSMMRIGDPAKSQIRPGHLKFSPAADPTTHEPYTIPKDGFRTTYYEMVGQYGTHVDPPAHFAESGITMDKIPLKQMILPLVVLDDTPYLAKDPNHAFSIDDLKAWERQHGRVPKGAFAALRTDMYKDWDADPERFKRSPFPAWALETIKFLYEERGVTATGHESMDTDTTDKMDSETYILQHGHYQIEVMANLDKVRPIGSLIVVSWPKVRDGLGFPARAFAILP
jgi:kynurenine formamidase